MSAVQTKDAYSVKLSHTLYWARAKPVIAAARIHCLDPKNTSTISIRSAKPSVVRRK